MWLGLGDRDPLGVTLGVSGQAEGGGTAGWGIGWVSGGQKPSSKPSCWPWLCPGELITGFGGWREQAALAGSEGKAGLEELSCGEGSNLREAKLVPCVLLGTAGKI